MKTIKIGLAILLMTAAASAADLDKAREELRSSEMAFAAAFGANDPESFATFVAEDAVFLAGSGQTLRGREAVVAVWRKMMADPKFGWEPSRVEVNDEGTLGTTTGPVRDLKGNHIGSFSSVWKRQEDGSWKVIFDGAPDCPRPPK